MVEATEISTVAVQSRDKNIGQEINLKPRTVSFLGGENDTNTDDATNMVVHDTLSHVNGVKMKDICVPNYFQSSEDDEEVQALVDVMCMHANVLHKMGVSQENKHCLHAHRAATTDQISSSRFGLHHKQSRRPCGPANSDRRLLSLATSAAPLNFPVGLRLLHEPPSSVRSGSSPSRPRPPRIFLPRPPLRPAFNMVSCTPRRGRPRQAAARAWRSHAVVSQSNKR